MVTFIFSFLNLIISLLFNSKKDLLSIVATLQKENEILKRTLKNNNLSVRFTNNDRTAFSFFHFLSEKICKYLTPVKPETVLKWYKKIIRNHWDFSSHSKRKPGRPQTPAAVRNLILDMKNDNPFMRTGKIQGELLKLGIKLSLSTIRRIIADLRKQGKIKSTLTWKKFIKAYIEHLFAMDFLTVTTFFGKPFYVFFIIYLILTIFQIVSISNYSGFVIFLGYKELYDMESTNKMTNPKLWSIKPGKLCSTG
ncbi:MAG: helix-turn-helix domain-containing protein [Spirochaetales bacterium]|nr:helix-turn-helix domain-containing protein [Spirochaetales bacterium]